MDVTIKYTNIDRYIDISAKVFISFYLILFTLYNTLIGKYYVGWIERLECITGAVLAVLFLIKLFSSSKNDKREWFFKSLPVLFYFIIRAACFVFNGFDYSIIRTIFFEGIYLLVICELIIDKEFIKTVLFKIFIGINLAFNICNVFFYIYDKYFIHISHKGTLWVYDVYVNYTYFTELPRCYYSSMYINPNTFGIMTAVSLILACSFFSKNNRKISNVLLAIYCFFSLYCVWISTCRTALIGLFIVLVTFILIKLIRFDYKLVLKFAMCIITLSTALMYTFIVMGTGDVSEKYTNKENMFNSITNERYSVWKEATEAHSDKLLLGTGSLKNELNERNQYMEKKYSTAALKEEFVPSKWGPHNGYFGMLFCTGILGFVLFMYILYKRINRIDNCSNIWCILAILFILLINIFECLLIVSKYYTCLLLFMLLEVCSEEKQILSVEETK